MFHSCFISVPGFLVEVTVVVVVAALGFSGGCNRQFSQWCKFLLPVGFFQGFASPVGRFRPFFSSSFSEVLRC